MRRVSWKYVFNTSVSDKKWWGSFESALKAAKNSGYSLIFWEKCIYTTEGIKTDYSIHDD